MPARNIVIGQKVDSAKVQRAREMRRRMTKEESVLWQRLRANRLGRFHFRRQQVIAGFIGDFYCHAAGLVVEVDGVYHQKRGDYDAERDRILSSMGLRVLHISNQDIVESLADVVNRIGAACPETPPDLTSRPLP